MRGGETETEAAEHLAEKQRQVQLWSNSTKADREALRRGSS